MGVLRFRAWLPWGLCAVSLVMITVGRWLESIRPAAVTEPWLWLEGVLLGLAAAGIPLVGAVIAARFPANPYGWLWCGIGLALGVFGAGGPVTKAVGGPPWVAATVEDYAFAFLAPLLILAILLFPDGRLPGPRWRWLARAVLALGILQILTALFVPEPYEPALEGPWALSGDAGASLRSAVIVAIWVLFAVGLAAVWALLLRYRRAGAVERQQLSWFLAAALFVALLLVLAALELWHSRLLSVVLVAISLAVFPAAVVVAVLRYRLYELDRIVSRTVSYGLLTAGLVGLYLLVVALLRPLLEPLTGGSSLAVAGSTLAVAAVFNPARRRLQAAVDRRFDRARYDAVRTVDAFAARLRHQVDLEEITAGLRDTVSTTVAPGRVAVWLRPADRGRHP
jgi:hypothetical protein